MKLNPQTGLVSPAKFLPSPNCDSRPPDTEIEVIVIHAISLPPGEYGNDFIAQLFTNRLDETAHPYFAKLRGLKVSAHFLIKRSGELMQFVSTKNRAWHAGESAFRDRQCVNDFSLGIELEGCDEEPFASSQYQILGDLIRCLTAHYPAIRRDNIIGHNDIAPTRKTDPGPHFDWQKLHRQLAATDA